MTIVEEVLSNVINPALVSVINRVAGSDVAIGCSGSKLLLAEKLEPKTGQADLGFVGKIISVNTEMLQSLLGKIVVLSPTATNINSEDDPKANGLLNINGDSATCAIAQAMHQTNGVLAMVTASNVAGVIKGFDAEDSSKGIILNKLSFSQAEKMRKENLVDTGMLIKLTSAFEAASFGIETCIVNGSAPAAIVRALVSSENFGTRIVADDSGELVLNVLV
jgi:acetylglutamate kinase